MIPLLIWIIGIALVLGLLGGFSLFAFFSLPKVLGAGLIMGAIYLLTKTKKNKLIAVALIIGGIFLIIK